MTYEEWEAQVNERIKREPAWESWGYRKALFWYDLVWLDMQKLVQDKGGRAIGEQLVRSAGSICANVEEGSGRGFGKQRNWFLGVAIGSARESKGWYWRARHLLDPEVLEHRLSLADEVIALQVNELSNQRSRSRKPR